MLLGFARLGFRPGTTAIWRVALVLAQPKSPTAVIWRSTVRTVVGTFRILRGAGWPWPARTPRSASQRLYLVAQLTTAIALASWHTAPVIPSMRRAALSPVQ